MEPGLTYIVRLYRQAGHRLTGVVEDVHSGRRMPFSSVRELWGALSRTPRSRPTESGKKPKSHKEKS
jgi:hypothetical protein